MIEAWYDTIDVPVNETTGQHLYVVKYKAKTEGTLIGDLFGSSFDTANTFAVYGDEQTAIAVVKALELGLI